MAQRKIDHKAKTSFNPGTSLIQDPLEIRRLLAMGMSSLAAVDLQIKGGEKRFHARLSDRDVGPGHIEVEFPHAKAEKEFLEAVGSSTTKECLVLIFLRGRSIVGMNATFDRRAAASLLHFSLPNRIFRIQRRANLRYEFPSGYDVEVELDAVEGHPRRVRKRLFDLSEGGLSFLVISPREASLFQVGSILKNIRFVIQGREIVADAEVRGRALKSNRGTAVGLKFERIEPEDQEFIAEFVTLRSIHLPL